MSILKIYWFYKVIQNIKNNNIKLVKLLIEKYFQDSFNYYFFKISYSYSYDCFDYFYTRLKVKNGGEYFLSYYTRVNIKTDNENKELKKIFHYDFGQNEESTMEDFDSEDEIDRLRYQIVSNLIKKNKFNIIITLVKNISQKSKNCIFKGYLENYKKFNQNHIEKLISILNINQNFFEKKVLDNYYNNINKEFYLFLKNHYDIDRTYYIHCFLRTHNNEVIEKISQDFNIDINNKIKKIHDTLSHNYKYKEGKKTFEIINFYQSIGYLNEETIVHSFKKKHDEIIIDFTYLPLLKLSKSTEIAMLKKNLEIIIFEKEYLYSYLEENNIENITMKLDSYFDFIKNKIDLDSDNMFIEELLEPIAVTSDKLLVYFYKKFPDIFLKKAFRILTRFFNDRRNPQCIIQQIENEKNNTRKDILLKILIHAYQKISYHHEEHNNNYLLIKNLINKENKIDILNSKITCYSALPIIKDIIQENLDNNSDMINSLFLKSICGVSKNSLYLLDNYNINLKTLVNGFMNLIYHENNQTNILFANKILEKNIILSEYEQYLVKEHNIELYKLYQSYSLNTKLENKYQIKNTKQKVVKI